MEIDSGITYLPETKEFRFSCGQKLFLVGFCNGFCLWDKHMQLQNIIQNCQSITIIKLFVGTIFKFCLREKTCYVLGVCTMLCISIKI